jgi:hypothetical protein
MTAGTTTKTPPKMKMTTNIPAEITTPDSIETSLGTLRFFDGLPDKVTVEKVFDNLDFMRAQRPSEDVLVAHTLRHTDPLGPSDRSAGYRVEQRNGYHPIQS